MPRDITTNLRFPERIYRDLQYAAERRGISMAAVVREAVASYLGRTADGQAIPVGDDPADRLIGSVASGPDDESVNHDRNLYGWPDATTDEAVGRHGRAARARDAKGSPSRGGGAIPQEPAARPLRADRSRARGIGDTPARARRRDKSRRPRS